MVDLFWEETSGRFYDTGRDHEKLILRPRDITDNAIPSGNSMAADILLRLGIYTGSSDFHRKATTALKSAQGVMVRFPTASGHWLTTLDFYLSKPKEVVIVGARGEEDTELLIQQVFLRFVPNRVLLGLVKSTGPITDLALAESRTKINNRATAYVCENYACMMPVNDPASLAEQLNS